MPSASPTANRPPRPRLAADALWLIFCAFCTCAGWGLSALHALNATSYAIAFVAGLAALFFWSAKTGTSLVSFPTRTALRRRFRRLCPLFFLTLAMLAFLGGALYGPVNYDGLAYRMARVLHWLAAGQWHWIHTAFERVNTHSPGYEWVAAPLIAFSHTGRLLFLIELASFCVLPGLLFQCFIRLGLRRRVAYAWMWILPSGYCFLLQAGSLGNDLFVVPFALAAIAYALRARQSRNIADLWLSLLGAALATGAKANAIPFGLIWVVVFVFSLPLLRRRVLATIAVGIVAVVSSFLPLAVANWRNCGDWTGAKAEGLHFTGTDLLGRWYGNAGMILLCNFSPPVIPVARQWNEKIAPRLIPPFLKDAVARDFDTGGSPVFSVDEIQVEEGASLGFGVSWLLLITGLAALFEARKHRRSGGLIPAWTTLQWLVFGATCLSVLAVMKLAFARSTVRLLAPYYPFMAMPLLALWGQGAVVRRRWWRCAVILVWAVAVMLLIVNPSRPLFPAQTALRYLRAHGVSGPLMDRADRVYTVFGQRADAFRPLLDVLPTDAPTVGLVTFDDPEAALWWPSGSRRIVHVCPGDTAAQLRAQGVRYILLCPDKFALSIPATPLDAWMTQMNARTLQKIPLTLRAADGPKEWWIVELL